MKLRSKDIINALCASLGYRLEPIRTKATKDTLPSDPFAAQQEIINRLGIDKPVVFDVGANKGDMAYAYRTILPQSSVHCFEPFPKTLEALTARFQSDPNVTIVPKAVSTEPGQTTFFVNNASATNSLLPRPDESERFYPKVAAPKGEITVQTIDLDSYAQQSGINHIDILKLDIQGGELMAISGAKDLLNEQRVGLIYTEIQFVPLYAGAAQFDAVWTTLRELGYALYDVYDLHRSAGGQLLYADALFVSQSCKDRVVSTLRIDN